MEALTFPVYPAQDHDPVTPKKHLRTGCGKTPGVVGGVWPPGRAKSLAFLCVACVPFQTKLVQTAFLAPAESWLSFLLSLVQPSIATKSAGGVDMGSSQTLLPEG